MSTGPHPTVPEADADQDARAAGDGRDAREVRDVRDVDVLAGWDPAGPPPVLDGGGPFPTDTVAVLAGMVIGMGLGLSAGGRHPLVRAQVGGIAGIAVAIAARRMWRLPG
jgi:hypothetical protein